MGKELPKIATIRLNDILKNKLMNIEADGQPKSTDYSFLKPGNIYQSPELIALMFAVTNIQPIQLVSFKPVRALLHEVEI